MRAPASNEEGTRTLPRRAKNLSLVKRLALSNGKMIGNK
jgi:hypothetical protein